jgi:hypothetical protein
LHARPVAVAILGGSEITFHENKTMYTQNEVGSDGEMNLLADTYQLDKYILK